MYNGANRIQSITASGTTFTTVSAHNLAVNDYVRFFVTGGTSYSGINPLQAYKILTTPTTTTFTVGLVQDTGSISSAVNAGSAGTGSVSVGL